MSYDTGSLTWVRCQEDGCKTELLESSPSDYCEEHSPEDSGQKTLRDI